MDRRRLIGGGAAYLAGAAVSARAGDIRAFEGSRFTVCRYDAKASSLRLVLSDSTGRPLRSFARLVAQPGFDPSRVRFAMNAGMFGTDGQPIGLYVEDGVVRHALNRRDGRGNFYMRPNGVFFVAGDGAPGIETSELFARRTVMPVWATQSGPMLVVDGALHPAITADGPSKYIRNAVGLARDGGALFVISEAPVSFGRLARFMRDSLGCRQALYLDGYVSSLWLPSQSRRDARAELGPMVVVTDKR